jgi:hypothetical protein
MHKLIAVGGTGQDVLQHYLICYLCGLVKEPFEAVVIDADSLRPGIALLARLFDEVVLNSSSNLAFGTAVPRIRYVPVRPRGNRVSEALMGYPPNDNQLVAANAFFDDDNLKQTLDKGLFARPALSSVLSSADVMSSEALKPDKEGRVFVVGSLLGGTGGGLLARIIDGVHAAGVIQGGDPKIRAVLFGEYFEPTDGLISQTRMRSNQYMVLKALSEGQRKLYSYVIIDADPSTIVRNRPPMDKLVLPLPDAETNPIWRGVNAVEWLRHDEVKAAAVNFKEREIEIPSAPIPLSKAKVMIRKAAGAGQRTVDENVPKLVAIEPWATRLWGQPLLSFTRELVGKIPGQTQANKLSQLHGSLREVWAGGGSRNAIADLFTDIDPVSPDHFKAVSWPGEPMTVDSPAPPDLRQRAASNFLFHCLRGTR